MLWFSLFIFLRVVSGGGEKWEGGLEVVITGSSVTRTLENPWRLDSLPLTASFVRGQRVPVAYSVESKARLEPEGSSIHPEPYWCNNSHHTWHPSFSWGCLCINVLGTIWGMDSCKVVKLMKREEFSIMKIKTSWTSRKWAGKCWYIPQSWGRGEVKRWGSENKLEEY